ncbi:MAG: ImmA/IrrE family metallo-endopeptidase [Blastocatellia bacterium]|nr:ImmA/IrrE family metallo-endopeptidase [Blastocatellia bacterium]MBL8194234.1 ImmA/IrrE family metallo-endopeptidase [Blastocatellia bacterium]MBN8722002.1 ImmA/IrrE family metallo-endopeptidase [Acidobacteriota bacterium]
MLKGLENNKLPESELLPPTIKRKIFERIALKIRDLAATPLDRALDPWQLAPKVKLKVVDINQLSKLSEETRKILLKKNSKDWSGATTMPLPNGWRLVFINPGHSRERQVATLMEEVSHVVLRHSPSLIKTPDEQTDQTQFRDFNKSQEEAAYGVGSAALIPYYILRLSITRGISIDRIAQKFGVSEDLVLFRIKVCRLWDSYKQCNC